MATALVTDVNDPDDLGRVKLKFPWLVGHLRDATGPAWCSSGAGKDRGAVMLPEVNDEVLVAFEQGDIRRPYVIGGLFNGVDKPDARRRARSTGPRARCKRRGFISKKGHKLVFLDDDGQVGRRSSPPADNELRIAAQGDGDHDQGRQQRQGRDRGRHDVTIKAEANVETQGRRARSKLQGERRHRPSTAGPSVEVKGAVIKLN